MQSLSSLPLFHIAFYRFTPISEPEVLAADLRRLTEKLSGSVLVAHEGINGVLAGTASALDAFEQSLCDPHYLKGAFVGLAFRRSACETPPFAKIKIHCKNEIVALGAGCTVGSGKRGIDVSPKEWRELIAQDDVVVIDNRNSFEHRLGRFKGSIDPQVSTFRDFSHYIEVHAPIWQAAGKRIAMYCTGGIRCEKTSACMSDFGIDIYQLEGGILNYFQTIPDAQLEWEGECFVFDNRMALDTSLKETQTNAEQVYNHPEDAWRLARALRLEQGP